MGDGVREVNQDSQEVAENKTTAWRSRGSIPLSARPSLFRTGRPIHMS